MCWSWRSPGTLSTFAPWPFLHLACSVFTPVWPVIGILRRFNTHGGSDAVSIFGAKDCECLFPCLTLDKGSTQASLNIARGKNWPRLFKKGFQSSHALAVILRTALPISPLSQSSDQWREAKTSGDKPSLASQQITFRQVSYNIALQQSKGSGMKFYQESR